MDRWMSVRRAALSRKRRSGARCELPLWDVPPHVRRSLHDLRPLPGERGSLDRPDLVRPDDHVWTNSQLPWLEVVDDLPRFATISDAVPSRALGDDDQR